MKYLVTYLSKTKNKPVQTYIQEETSGKAIDAAIDEIEDCGSIVGVRPINTKK